MQPAYRTQTTNMIALVIAVSETHLSIFQGDHIVRLVWIISKNKKSSRKSKQMSEGSNKVHIIISDDKMKIFVCNHFLLKD